MSLVQHPPPTTDLCDVVNATIDALPDEVLLEVFEFYVADIDVDDEERLGNPVTCVPKVAIHCVCVITSLGTANCLHSWDTCRDGSWQ